MLMNRRIGYRRSIGGAAAVLALAGGLAPSPVHAGGDIYTTLTQGMVCQISITFQFGTQISSNLPASPTAPVGDQIVASGGSCLAEGTGMSGNQPFAISGGGTTEIYPTCADMVIAGNGGLVTIGTQQFATTFFIAGPAADSQWVMAMTAPILSGSAGAGTAQLSLAPASLQACLQPGGTNTLTFTGAAVFAF